MKWTKEKETLDSLINKKNISYEEIGRMYGCTGGNIKKVAYRLGITIPKRRKINQIETFNKGVKKTGICKNCGKEIMLYKNTKGLYCSRKCQVEYEQKKWVERWKNGEESGLSGKYAVSKHIRTYLFDKNSCKCEKCGWGEVNKYTGKIPLQIHHINGDCTDNKENNLELLCPNCHSLTENFGSRNKNASNGRSEYFAPKKMK